MYWVLETLQFQFWTKFNKPSPTRKFLNGGVALTGYSRIGTLKRMHNTTFLWEIANSNWKPSCLICWSSAYVHDVRYMIWGFQNADCLRCVIWQHTKKKWISIFFSKTYIYFLIFLLFFSSIETSLDQMPMKDFNWPRPKVFHFVLHWVEILKTPNCTLITCCKEE